MRGSPGGTIRVVGLPAHDPGVNELLRLSLSSDGVLIGAVVVAVLLAVIGAAALGRHRGGAVRRLAAVLLVLVLPVAGVMAVGGLLINRHGQYLQTVGDLVGVHATESTDSASAAASGGGSAAAPGGAGVSGATRRLAAATEEVARSAVGDRGTVAAVPTTQADAPAEPARAATAAPTAMTAAPSTTSTGPALVGDVRPLATAAQLDAVPASAWRATFTKGADGVLTATWTGPVSGISLEVNVVVPSGYSAADGRGYGVIEALHGYRGTPDSMIGALESPSALQAAIDAHRIPPSIIVIPSLNADDNAHDCANLAGRPAVGTWVAQEIPRMVRASFPNVTGQREGWMALGISAGAYCAGWAALAQPETFGSAAVMSSYDRPAEGGLATSGDAVADAYTLSHLLAASHPVLGTRFYALGAQDDALKSAQTAWSMAEAVHAPDTVTTDTPPTGGHAWSLWSARFPAVLAWWGSDPAVWNAVEGAAPSTSATRTADAALLGTITDTPRSQRNAGPVTPGTWAPVGAPVLGVAAAASALCLAALILVARRRGRVLAAVRAGERRPAGPVLAVSGWAGRVVLVAGCAVVIACALGLAGNAVTGYCTTWAAILASF